MKFVPQIINSSPNQLSISFVKQQVNRAGNRVDFNSCHFIRINVPGLQNGIVYTISNDEICSVDSSFACRFKIAVARFSTSTTFSRDPYID